MAITSLDQYLAAPKPWLTWMKTGTRTLIASMPYSVFDVAGNPGAGTLNVGNTANGLVHTDATAGYPLIPSFGGAPGYIGRVDYSSSVPCRLLLYDRLFVAGAYAYNSGTINLTGQPSFASRVPDGNYSGLELWVEGVTAIAGLLSTRVTYLDQDGNAGDTGVIATGVTPPVGRCVQLPLAAGDSGLRQINSVTPSVITGGTFNVMVLRPLGMFRVPAANSGSFADLLATGLPRIYDDSALYVMVAADSTAVGLPMLHIQVPYA